MTERIPWLAVIGLSGATLVAMLSPTPGWVDAFVILVFALFAPGLVVVGVIRTTERLVELVVLLMTGAPLWALVATLSAFTEFWHPYGIMLTAAVLLLAVGAAGLVRVVREEATFSPDPRAAVD